MDLLHERVARVALTAIGGQGFVLAGGNAIIAHGFSDRPTRDVDLFTNRSDPQGFALAVGRAVTALQRDRLAVDVRRQVPHFAQLRVGDEVGRGVDLELAVDYRADEPVRLALGPVLSPDDAVAAKVVALYSRGEVRDFLDVDAAVQSGAYGREVVAALADARSPQPLDRRVLASQLRYGSRLADERFSRYGLRVAETRALRDRMAAWASRLEDAQ